LAQQAISGLITRTRLAFALPWSARRQRHQAIARWYHHNARLLATATESLAARKEVTQCNAKPAAATSREASRRSPNEKPRL
jgi:hypothetical protein